jgi:hypothetical protein
MDSLELSFGAASLEEQHHITPIDRIPNDVLANIFQELVNEDPEQAFQFILGQICCRWRGLVLNLPLLWTQLHISMRSHPQFVRLFIKRSKDVPFDIFMELRPGEGKWKNDLCNILDDLIPHSCRWRRLVVHAYDSGRICCIPGKFMHLVSNPLIFARRAISMKFYHIHFSPFVTFSLRSIRFHGLCPPSFAIAWHALILPTHLSMTLQNFSVCYRASTPPIIQCFGYQQLCAREMGHTNTISIVT